MNDKERTYFMGEVCKVFALNLPETVQTQRLNSLFDQIYGLGQQNPAVFAGGVKKRKKATP